MANNKYKILVIEDDENIRTFISTILETEGYYTIIAKKCSEGITMFYSYNPDLVILDLGLPDRDGMEFLKEIRSHNLTPIIVLSARTDEHDKVTALDSGANDYVTKPFSALELMARIRTALRSKIITLDDNLMLEGKFILDDLTINYDTRQVYLKQQEIKLTQTEYNILVLLTKSSGKLLTYFAIVKAIWGSKDEGSIKKLQVNMANIRKKLGIKPGEESYIINELGVGYRININK